MMKSYGDKLEKEKSDDTSSMGITVIVKERRLRVAIAIPMVFSLLWSHWRTLFVSKSKRMKSFASKFLVLVFSVSIFMNCGSSTMALSLMNSSINIESIKPAITISQFITSHNAARRVIGVPPLSWDSKLATFARVYANQRRKDCLLIHSPGEYRYAYGENIFWGKGRRWIATDVVASWVAEKQWYHYNTNSCSGPDCTHYTQIVWRTTKRVGCAKIVCDSGDSFAVCEYYPPGNYIGARPYIQPDKKP
ncbi:hypothetical protein J5N97_026744 [Dioscorea zingiberensis]|uniref:SCP domain-containing protein n=1 Tax=Dioscorea zingiberensis TaxID=325984 RepID=A0A9D5C2S7_9LILI|nr:hypothetical protein J5N97_026744 [Dioscorea zingiberensis]